jgi:hypothetical protein
MRIPHAMKLNVASVTDPASDEYAGEVRASELAKARPRTARPATRT